MLPNDEVFQSILPNALARSPGSPELGPPFEGIRIAAPRSLTTGQRLVLCAGVRMRYGALGLADHAQHAYVLAVRADGDSRLGRPIGSDGRPIADEQDARIVEGTVKVLSFFTTDLFETLDVPREPAVWFVHAFLGPHVSNGVRVEIVAEATA